MWLNTHNTNFRQNIKVRRSIIMFASNVLLCYFVAIEDPSGWIYSILILLRTQSMKDNYYLCINISIVITIYVILIFSQNTKVRRSIIMFASTCPNCSFCSLPRHIGLNVHNTHFSLESKDVIKFTSTLSAELKWPSSRAIVKSDPMSF